VSDDRVDESGHTDAVEEIADEAATADHRAGGDGGAGVGEGELENPERQQRHASGAVGRRETLKGKAVQADEPVSGLEHEGEAPEPERDTANASVGDPFHQDVDRLARAREPGLEQYEADLHSEHEERGHQRPHGVDRVYSRHGIEGGSRWRRLGSEHCGQEPPRDQRQHDAEPDGLSEEEQPDVAPNQGVLPVRAQPCADSLQLAHNGSSSMQKGSTPNSGRVRD